MTQNEVTFYINPLEKTSLLTTKRLSICRTCSGNPNGFKGSTWARDLHLEGFFVDENFESSFQALIELQCVKRSVNFFPKIPARNLYIPSGCEKKTQKYTSYVEYLPCSCGRDYSLHCEASTSAIMLVVEPTP